MSILSFHFLVDQSSQCIPKGQMLTKYTFYTLFELLLGNVMSMNKKTALEQKCNILRCCIVGMYPQGSTQLTLISLMAFWNGIHSKWISAACYKDGGQYLHSTICRDGYLIFNGMHYPSSLKYGSYMDSNASWIWHVTAGHLRATPY